MFGSTGSILTRRAPRGEQGVRLSDTSSGVDAVQSAGAPWFTQLPGLAAVQRSVEAEVRRAGISASAPPQQVLETPRTARPEAAKMTFELPGFTSIEPTARPANSFAPIGPCQTWPPLLDT